MNIKKQLAIILILALALQLLPLNTFARSAQIDTGSGGEIAEVPAEMDLGAANDPVPAPVLETENSSAYVVAEDPSLRSASEKHFRLSNGSFAAVDYGETVHYQDEAGTWQDVDNTLFLQKADTASSVYRSRNGDEVRSFAAVVDETGYLFTAESGKTAVAFYAQDTSHDGKERSDAVTAVVENPAAPTRSEEEFQALPLAEQVELRTLTSGLSYSDLWEKTDLAYQIHGLDVKESIVLNGPEAANAYAFRMELDGLSAVLTEEGGISLTDPKGEEVFYIPAPYMEDAKG